MTPRVIDDISSKIVNPESFQIGDKQLGYIDLSFLQLIPIAISFTN